MEQIPRKGPLSELLFSGGGGGGITPTGTKQISINENGTVTEDVTNYASAEITVNVIPGPTQWERPEGWPDYSKLPNLKTNNIEAEFFTYDNREAAREGVQALVGWQVLCSVTTAGVIHVDRVSIGNDGTITVLDSQTFNQNSNIRFSIPLDAGDFVCYRVTPADGHITEIRMMAPSSGTYEKQRCVERYGNLPYCKVYGSTSKSYKWGCVHLVSDTLLTVPADLETIDWDPCPNLVNLPTDTWPDTITLGNYSFKNAFNEAIKLKEIPIHKFDLKNVTSLESAFSFARLDNTVVDLHDMSIASCESIRTWFQYSNITRLRFPKNMGAITNTANCMTYCFDLEVAEFEDGTFNTTEGISNHFFDACQSMEALIIRGNTVCPLQAAAGVSTFATAGGGYIFVPQAVLEDYKTASNWISVASFIKPIEGSYWETHHADDTLIVPAS